MTKQDLYTYALIYNDLSPYPKVVEEVANLFLDKKFGDSVLGNTDLDSWGQPEYIKIMVAVIRKITRQDFSDIEQMAQAALLCLGNNVKEGLTQ